MKRSFEQREMLTLLLAAPSRIISNDVGNTPPSSSSSRANQNNNHIRQLATHLQDGTVANFPAYQLKSIFAALYEECRGSSFMSGVYDDSHNNKNNRSSVIVSPNKRARKTTPTCNNNLHSILRLIERIISKRYDNNNKSITTKSRRSDDQQYLDRELKRYFGTKDGLFRTEEDILCLAFMIAHDAIKCRVEKNKQSSSSRPLSQQCILEDCVVETALSIIDIVIQIDIRERRSRHELQDRFREQRRCQTASPNQTSHSSADRRKKTYEHLLKPKMKKGGGNRANRYGVLGAKNSSTKKVKCIMEERYPDQWAWLHHLRASATDRSKADCPDEDKDELQNSHYSKQPADGAEDGSRLDERAQQEFEKNKNGLESDFVIIRRRIETLDDISLSSHDSDDEEIGNGAGSNKEVNTNDDCQPNSNSGSQGAQVGSDTCAQPAAEPSPGSVTESAAAAAAAAKEISPLDKLDQETRELRLTLLDIPASESASPEVARHTVDEIVDLLSRYGDVDGAAGISRCGDIFGGNSIVIARRASLEGESLPTADGSGRFPLNDNMVTLLVKAYLTDATGALRAKVFLRSFVLPLMLEMNPVTKAFVNGSKVDGSQKAAKGKPASRLLTSLLATLARDRPAECVVSVIVPSLVLKKCNLAPSTFDALFEPTRFQCELFSRVLKGKDALSLPAIALLVEEVLPTKEDMVNSTDESARGGMKWTDNSMPVLTACLNRHPTLSDGVVSKLADEITFQLSPSKTTAVVKSMKFSSLFHALVTKYGSQVKSSGKIDVLQDGASRLKTFMSKTIGLSLKKLS